jgi:ribosomal protein S18 acetylase RimI-like enzyme
MSELEPQLRPAIVRPTVGDVESYRRMQMQSWMDTYPNEDAGVSLEWVTTRTQSYLTPEAIERSKERVQALLDDSTHQFIYVAKVGDASVGMINATSIEGHQRLEALYVDKAYHGTGTAQALMDIAMAQLDMNEPVVLEVVAYNERAQRFYQKNGFAIVPGSEHVYAEVLPSLKMIRPGGL